MVGRLIAAGAAVDKATADSVATPLFVAAQGGHDAVVGRLLAAGADANKATYAGENPLDVARLFGHEAVVAQLS